MARLFCPICGQERSMRVDTESKQAAGGKQRIPQRAYHCEVCDTLVKREDMP